VAAFSVVTVAPEPSVRVTTSVSVEAAPAVALLEVSVMPPRLTAAAVTVKAVVSASVTDGRPVPPGMSCKVAIMLADPTAIGVTSPVALTFAFVVSVERNVGVPVTVIAFPGVSTLQTPPGQAALS